VSGPSPLRWLKSWICLALILALCGAAAEGWAAVRGQRTKARPAGGETFEVEADESVAEQVNDPTSFLREIGVDVSIEHGAGSKHTLVEWTPRLALPLGRRFRFEAGVPVFANAPGDRDDVELGDIYASLAYIFASSQAANFLADVRIDLPTGNELRQAGRMSRSGMRRSARWSTPSRNGASSSFPGWSTGAPCSETRKVMR
jgi:hypothetical protein